MYDKDKKNVYEKSQRKNWKSIKLLLSLHFCIRIKYEIRMQDNK